MNTLFHRRIYKHFGLLKDRLMTARHYSRVRTLKTAYNVYHSKLCRPLSVLSYDHAACPVFCQAHRHLADDAHLHKDRIEVAADGRWSNRCNCCGRNSRGTADEALCHVLALADTQIWDRTSQDCLYTA